MPIRPENVKRYPANWEEIRGKILERANHQCETPECRVHNGAWGWRDSTGHFHFVSFDRGLAVAKEGQRKLIRIVLTIAHLDHVPENCDPANLRAWCQRCHNRYDAPMRAAGRKERNPAHGK